MSTQFKLVFLTVKASCFPLRIDLQQQAIRWVRRIEEKNSITIKMFSVGEFMKHLELAIQFGNPFLL